MSSMPPPEVFGLPEKFQEWRPDQEKAITHFTECDSRFILSIMPTGSGKSLVYMTAALLHPGRSVILTSTKGLQKQLELDFARDLGLVKVMGKNAYKCKFIPTLTGDYAPCNFGLKCMYKDFGCPYYAKIREAERADIVVTNYAFWHSNDPDGPQKYKIGKFDLLICDESHNAVNHLLDALSVHLTKKRIEKLGYEWPGSKLSDEDYWDFIEGVGDDISNEIEEIRSNAHILATKLHDKDFQMKCRFDKEVTNRLSGVDREKWIVECTGYELTFDPIWPSDFSEELLFRGVPKILMTSATINEKIMNFLGVHNK